jgi:hypothetical protein
MSSTIFPTQLKEFLSVQTADGLQYKEAFEKGIGKKDGVYSGNDSETMIANGVLYNLDGYEKYKGTKSVTLDPSGSSNNFGIDIRSGGRLLKKGKVIYLPNEDDNMKKMVQGAYDSLGGGSEHGEGYEGQGVVRNESGANPVKFMSVDKFEKQIEGEAAANVNAGEPSESIAYFNDITRHSMVDENGDIPEPLEMVHVYSDQKVREENEKIMTQAYVKYTSKHFAQKLLNKPVNYAENKKTSTGGGSESDKTSAGKLKSASEGFATMLYNMGGELNYDNLGDAADSLSLPNAEQVVDVETNPWVSLEAESVSKEFKGPSGKKTSFKKGDSPKQMAVKAISVKYGYNTNEATKVYEESLKKVEILKKRYKDVESEFEKSASSGLKGDARAAMKKAYMQRNFRTTF